VVILAIKLVLVPALIASITLAGTRFGPRVAGALTGFPVVAGPIVLFIALEQGTAFAERSAAATLAGLGSLAAFCVAYAVTASRLSWWGSTLVGWLAFLVATLVLDRLAPALPASIAIALIAPLVVIWLAPRPEVGRGANAGVGASEIALRMLAGMTLMLMLTGIAHLLGPRLSGLLTVFPIATTILAAFSHRRDGAAFAVQMLRGLAGGLYCLGAFFITLAFTLDALGVMTAFVLASVAAVTTQAVVLGLVGRGPAQSQA
jgi:hypothetical protein